jgi:hypothetical protein
VAVDGNGAGYNQESEQTCRRHIAVACINVRRREAQRIQLQCPWHRLYKPSEGPVRLKATTSQVFL